MSDTTEEIEPTTDTLEQPTLADVMKAIAGFKKETDAQLEAIREGIVFNASRFDRLESKLYSVQSDISSLKADIRDLTEEVRRGRKALV